MFLDGLPISNVEDILEDSSETLDGNAPWYLALRL